MNRLILVLGMAVLLAGTWQPASSFAVTPAEQLSDPALEERARLISKDLRCVVCQNQSIDGSNAPLAADMRKLVRERLLAGDSNDQVTAYIVDRYGNFVLLKPPFVRNTYGLWIGPLAFLIVGGLLFYVTARRKKTTEIAREEIPDADDQRINDLINQIRK